MTSRSKDPSLWGCITGASKWNDYFAVLFGKKTPENSNEYVYSTTSSENYEGNNSSTTLEGEGSNRSGFAFEEAYLRKMGVLNTVSQPFSESGDNIYTLKAHNQHINENKGATKSVLGLERNKQIVTEKVCDFSDVESQYNAEHRNTSGSVKADSKRSTAKILQEKFERAYQHPRVTETALLKEVTRKITTGDIFKRIKIREVTKKKTTQELRSKPGYSTSLESSNTTITRGLSSSDYHIHLDRNDVSSDHKLPTRKEGLMQMIHQEGSSDLQEHDDASDTPLENPKVTSSLLIPSHAEHCNKLEVVGDISAGGTSENSKGETKATSGYFDSQTMAMSEQKYPNELQSFLCYSHTDDVGINSDEKSDLVIDFAKNTTTITTIDEEELLTKLVEPVDAHLGFVPNTERKVRFGSFNDSPRTTKDRDRLPELQEQHASSETPIELSKDASQLRSNPSGGVSENDVQLSNADSDELSKIVETSTESIKEVPSDVQKKETEKSPQGSINTMNQDQSSASEEVPANSNNESFTSETTVRADKSSSSYSSSSLLIPDNFVRNNYLLPPAESKLSLIRQVSRKFLNAGKAVKFLIFKRPQEGNDTFALIYEAQGSRDKLRHNQSNSPLRVNPSQTVAGAAFDPSCIKGFRIQNLDEALLKHRIRAHNCTPSQKSVNLAEQVLRSSDVLNFKPENQRQSYNVYTFKGDCKPAGFIPETDGRSTIPTHPFYAAGKLCYKCRENIHKP